MHFIRLIACCAAAIALVGCSTIPTSQIPQEAGTAPEGTHLASEQTRIGIQVLAVSDGWITIRQGSERSTVAIGDRVKIKSGPFRNSVVIFTNTVDGEATYLID